MKELETIIQGKGEVKGYIFTQVAQNEYAFLYEVTHKDFPSRHYEVFKRRENKQFGTISFPSSPSFGLWAWTYPTLEMAEKKFQDITSREISKISLPK